MLNLTQLMPTRRAMLIAKRDYLTSIRSKAFLIGLIIFPMLFGGGLIGIAAMKAKPDLRDRHVALIDRTGKLAPYVVDAAARKNATDTIEHRTGVQTSPRYLVEPVAGERRPERAAAGALRPHPAWGPVRFHRSRAGGDSSAGQGGRTERAKGPGRFLQQRGQDRPRRRLAQRRIERWHPRGAAGGVGHRPGTDSVSDEGRRPRHDEPGGARSENGRDSRTGERGRDRRRLQCRSRAMMLLAMVVMIGAAPMMTGVTEDKSQRIVEMLLGIATPLDLMAGKVMAGVARSLTSSLLYVTGATVVLLGMNVVGIAPLTLLPWFYAYLLAEVTLLCALAAGLGAACNTPQEAGNLVMVVMAPIMIPMFMIVPVASKPNGAFATAISLFPPFTPLIMMLRQTMPGGVPAWQPWAGLAGTIVFAVLGIWVASRIFRVGF